MDCRWNQDFLDLAALHEIGHAIGFAHPEDFMNGAVHIAETFDFSLGTYATIMHAVPDGVDARIEDCDPDYAILQPDDELSAQLTYPD